MKKKRVVNKLTTINKYKRKMRAEALIVQVQEYKGDPGAISNNYQWSAASH